VAGQPAESAAETTVGPASEPYDEPEPYISSFDAGMREVNPDYVFWISIADTQVDYPVVRAGDNEKYLDLSFSGEKNMLGALFMDYRCEGEIAPNPAVIAPDSGASNPTHPSAQQIITHIIIYGHNSRQGDFFGGLHYFLDAGYLAERPEITIKVNDRIFIYKIFSARRTTVNDPAYFLDFDEPGSFGAFLDRCGAPPEAEQIITLSTCVSGYDADERIVVQGMLLTSH
jgi:sortase B